MTNKEQLSIIQPHPPYFHTTQKVVRHVEHFYLSGPIREPDGYAEMVHTILTATEEDIIYLHLNCPGGNLDTGVQLINALNSSQAHIIASIESSAASLATLLFLCADEFLVHDNSIMMFHNYSGGAAGKGHEIMASAAATDKWCAELMKKLYLPFLTQQEFDRVKDGADLYFHSDEIRERLQRIVDAVEKQNSDDTPTKPKRKKKPIDK